jgi:hypothetical protein
MPAIGSVIYGNALPKDARRCVETGHCCSGEDAEITTLEPDSTRVGCKSVQVGSTPHGVSDSPTACWDDIN